MPRDTDKYVIEDATALAKEQGGRYEKGVQMKSGSLEDKLWQASSSVEKELRTPTDVNIYDFPDERTDRYYPDGGLEAWLVVVGSWCCMFACFSFMNTIGTFQSYVSTHQLAGYPESTIGWVFSTYIFLAFFCGIQIGPIFDMKGPRLLVASGSLCLLLGVFTLAESTKLWHFFITFSLLGGVGTSLLFTPSVACIAHYFNARRGLAIGLGTTAGSIGGTIFPLILPQLLDRVGFAWATRIMGFIQAFALIFGNMLIKARLPPKNSVGIRDFLPDLRILTKDRGEMAVCTLGIFAIEWGLFVPQVYITSWAIHTGVGSITLSYQLLAIMNVGSFFGRWAPGFLSDRIGPFNTIILASCTCLLALLTFWLPGTIPLSSTSHSFGSAWGSIPLAVLFCLMFGFGSGSGISLTPVCVGQLCRVEHYGRYYATSYTIVSIGCLTGVPIAGALVQVCGGEYTGLLSFAAACYVVGIVAFIAVRILLVGWGIQVIC